MPPLTGTGTPMKPVPESPSSHTNPTTPASPRTWPTSAAARPSPLVRVWRRYRYAPPSAAVPASARLSRGWSVRKGALASTSPRTASSGPDSRPANSGLWDAIAVPGRAGQGGGWGLRLPHIAGSSGGQRLMGRMPVRKQQGACGIAASLTSRQHGADASRRCQLKRGVACRQQLGAQEVE